MDNDAVRITDSMSDATADVLVGYGFNCCRFVAPKECGGIDLLWAADDFGKGHPRPSGSGIPVLFPFPGRIQGTTLSWEGRDYSLEPNDGKGNAIHGFVHERPWRLLEQTKDRVVAEFQASVDDPALLNHWPSDFQIRGEYLLKGGTLTGRFTLSNPGEKVLPCGMGLHPYFRVPLGGDAADACMVRVPVGSEWELFEMNATGKSLPLAADHPLAVGMPFGSTQFDNVFGELEGIDEVCTATVDDPSNGRRLTVQFGRPFRECVVYNPPHREAICIEPYTCVPDCFRLERDGKDAGLLCIKPGATIETSISMRIE